MAAQRLMELGWIVKREATRRVDNYLAPKLVYEFYIG